MDIFHFVTKEAAVFTWNKTLYSQKHGCAMGVNTSPTFAALAVNELLRRAIKLLSYTPKVITKYVDETFLIIPREHVDETLNVFNSIWPSIQFTIELEVNRSLPYLDVKITHSEDGSLHTNWNRKPTSAGKVLNFHSAHPIQQKINVAFNLFHRILSISDVQFRKNNINDAFNILLSNNYPHQIIRKQWCPVKIPNAKI